MILLISPTMAIYILLWNIIPSLILMDTSPPSLSVHVDVNIVQWLAPSSARDTTKNDLSVSFRIRTGAEDPERVRPGTMWVTTHQNRSGSCETTRSVAMRGSVGVCSPRLLHERSCFETNNRRTSCGHKVKQCDGVARCRGQHRNRHVGTCSCVRLQGTAGRHRGSL